MFLDRHLLFFSEVNKLPNASVLEMKKQQVADLSQKLSVAITGVLVDYSGISVADDTTLRKELREAGVEYFVVKNTILSRAIAGTDLEEMNSVLEGTTAIAISKDDYVAAARILKNYADAHDNFSIKAGYLDGKVISLDMVDSLAKLPSREVLLATVLGAFQAPMAAFARAVQAIVDKNGDAE
jgi:large subunit ribosomal protein L10